MYLSLSLSLYIYIYVYIYTYVYKLVVFFERLPLEVESVQLALAVGNTVIIHRDDIHANTNTIN